MVFSVFSLEELAYYMLEKTTMILYYCRLVLHSILQSQRLDFYYDVWYVLRTISSDPIISRNQLREI